jgi:hypothetical protein
VWQIPDAVDTVVCAPDDGWKYHPKHVEQFPDINKLCNVTSCWIYIEILLRAHLILHISRIRVKNRFASPVLHRCNVQTQICVSRPQCVKTHSPLSSHINLGLQSGHVLTFSHQKPVLISRPFVNMPFPLHPTWFSHTQNIRRRIKAMQLSIFCSLRLLNVYL